MNNSILGSFLAIIRSKIQPFLVKLRLWSSPSYVKARFITKFRDFFSRVLNVKPKNKKDYYTILGWMVSKRLAYAIVIVVGLLSAIYLSTTMSSYITTKFNLNGIKTYKYTSIPLKFAKGSVRIKGKSGYIAYEGEVSKGACNGNGVLYRPDGSIVYQGKFADSYFDGEGISYFENGKTMYNGTFSKNLYQGNGKLYRENGNLVYTGEFDQGLKDGQGVLYDNGGNPLYTGSFSRDDIVYAELLGKSTQDVGKFYTGNKDIFRMDNDFIVHMKDINAVYSGTIEEESLREDMDISIVYVLDNKFKYGDTTLNETDKITELLGIPTYEGNAYVTLPEAICINILNNTRGNAIRGLVDIDTNNEFSDYTTINSYDNQYLVYLYAYSVDGLMYTFVCSDKNEGFDFYYITQGGEN